MSLRLDHIQSRFDHADPIERLLRWWLASLRSLAPRAAPVQARELPDPAENIAGQTLMVELPTRSGFLFEIDMPPGPAQSHLGTLKLRASTLLPVSPDELVGAARVMVTQADGSLRYQVLTARRAELEEYDAELRGRGVRSVRFCPAADADLFLISDAERARQHRDRIVIGGLLAAVVVGAAISALIWTTALDREYDQLLAQEQALRSQSIAQGRQGALADAQNDVAIGYLMYSSLEQVREDLAKLSAVVPSGLAVETLAWQPQRMSVQLTLAAGTQSPDWASDLLGWTMIEPEEGAEERAATSHLGVDFLRSRGDAE